MTKVNYQIRKPESEIGPLCEVLIIKTLNNMPETKDRNIEVRYEGKCWENPKRGYRIFTLLENGNEVGKYFMHPAKWDDIGFGRYTTVNPEHITIYKQK